jgi:hypothetical protein
MTFSQMFTELIDYKKTFGKLQCCSTLGGESPSRRHHKATYFAVL